MSGGRDVLAGAVDRVTRSQECRSSEKNNQAGESDGEVLAHDTNLSPVAVPVGINQLCKSVFGKGACERVSARPSLTLPECARVTSCSANIGTTVADYDNQKVVTATLYISNGAVLDGTFSIRGSRFSSNR